MENKDVISSICFKLKNENGNLISFNSESVTFRLSIKEIQELDIYNFLGIYTRDLLTIIRDKSIFHIVNA